MTSSLRLYPNWSWVRTNQNARIIWIIIYLFCTVILIYGSVVKNIISVTMLMEGFPEILGSIVRTVKLLGHPLEFPCRDFRDRAILVLSWLLMQMLGDSAIYKGTQSMFKYEKILITLDFPNIKNSWAWNKKSNYCRLMFVLFGFGKLAALLS